MKIAVLSDLHDNYADWRIINKILKEEKIRDLIFTGDLAAPSMLKKMIEEFDGHIYMVWGNVADKELEKKVADENLDKVTHFGDLGEFELNGKKIAITHYPEKARVLVESQKYDLVCFGHNHQKMCQKVGRSFFLNPGTAGGMFQYPSFAIFDLKEMTYRFKEVTL